MLKRAGNRPLQNDVQENGVRFVERFLNFFGLSKISKYEDEVPEIKFNVHNGLPNNADSQLDGTGDTLPYAVSRGKARKENKATQTDDVVKCDQEVQTTKPKRGRFQRYIRRSFKCLRTEE